MASRLALCALMFAFSLCIGCAAKGQHATFSQGDAPCKVGEMMDAATGKCVPAPVKQVQQ